LTGRGGAVSRPGVEEGSPHDRVEAESGRLTGRVEGKENRFTVGEGQPRIFVGGAKRPGARPHRGGQPKPYAATARLRLLIIIIIESY
jgi:hypothetical protein